MAGYSGFGTRFERGDGGTPETFDLIGEATDISGPEQERDTIEVTSHQSPNGFREWVGGLSDGGEVSFEVRYDPALHNVLQDDFADPQPRNYRIVLPDPPGGIWNFARSSPPWDGVPDGGRDELLVHVQGHRKTGV